MVETWLRNLVRGVLYRLDMTGVDIYRQLCFEEFLYRNATRTIDNCGFLLINNHNISHELSEKDETTLCQHATSGTRAIVMGLSGTVLTEVTDVSECSREGVSVLNRYTGGGTVLIDENVLTCSMIATHSFINYTLDPVNICQWMYENFYVSSGLFKPGFDLLDGDYVMKLAGEYYKIAGNAQAYNDKSFVHHTSFLWEKSELISKLLRMPKKTPKYRNNRTHDTFLTSTKDALALNDPTIHEFTQILLNKNIKRHKNATNLKPNLDFIDRAINTLNHKNTKLILP